MKKTFTYLFSAMLCLGTSLSISAQVINTIAGTGTNGYDGDGVGTAKKLAHPWGLAVDASGNVYFSDQDNYLIRKMTPAGVMTTIGGIAGTFAFYGDEKPATTTTYNSVYQVAVDGGGTVYLAEATSCRIRTIDPSGMAHTIAGGLPGYSGDGGPATDAKLLNPSGVAVDASGNVYIGDYGNSVVRKIDAAGIITTVASVYQPYELAIDGTGNIYVAQWGGYAVSKIDPSGVVSSFYTNGNRFNSVAVDPAGNVYAGDGTAIHKIDPTGATVTLVTGSNTTGGYSGDGGPATAALVNNVGGIAIGPTGNIYLSDISNNRVREITYPIIPVAPITGATSVCVGTTTTLSNATSGGVWTSHSPGIASVDPSTGVVTGVTGGATTITYTTPSNFTTISMTVNVPGVGGTGKILGLNYACPATTVILSESVPGGIWSTSDPAICTITASGIVRGISPGTAVITYTVAGSCGTTADLKFPFRTLSYDDCKAGVAPAPTANGIDAIQVWPNPNEGTFTINLASGIDEDAQVTVSNVVGELIAKYNTMTNQHLEISMNAAGGVYLLNAISAHSKWTQKVLVNASPTR